MCGEAPETIAHALLLCDVAKEVWYFSPLRLVFQDENCQSLLSWCKAKGEQIKNKLWWDNFWSILWGIWLRRNSWLFEKKDTQVVDVIRKATGIVGEYEKANSILHYEIANRSLVSQAWSPPAAGSYKLNSDAAIFKDEAIGLGGIVRDCCGDVMLATCCRVSGSYEVDIAEAMAARHSIGIAIDAGLIRLTLESDSLKLIHHLKSKKMENSYFGRIVADILHLARACTFFEVSHIGRKGNGAAHKLAHISKNYVEMRVWIEEVPDDVNSAIAFDSVVNNNI